MPIVGLIDRIRQYNTLELELQGELPEEEDRHFVPLLPRRHRLTVWDIERILGTAAHDPSIRALYIKTGEIKIGLARAEALRRAIARFAETGKPVYVYLEGAGNVQYFISTAAGIIIIPPFGTLNLTGLGAQVTFFKDLLVKSGVEASIKNVGMYKSAAEAFTRSSMSGPHREMMEAIFDGVFDVFLSGIAERPGLDTRKAQEAVDGGPYPPLEAVALGLVDEVCYEKEVEKLISDSLGERYKAITAHRYKKMLGFNQRIESIRSYFSRSGHTIALMTETGLITGGESRTDGPVRTIGSSTVTRLLTKVEEDNTVEALVLRILSPGGSAVASDIILHHLEAVARKKPVVVTMSDVAASGGYMVALGATRIIAERTTLTGSIGVISGKFVLSGLLEKLGVGTGFIQRGKSSLFFSPRSGYTPEEEARLNTLLNTMYGGFLARVSASRGMDPEEAERQAQGRVWTGADALASGLIDGIGGTLDAFQSARELAGIHPEERVRVKKFYKPRAMRLMPMTRGYSILDGASDMLALYTSLAKESALAVMPFRIDFF